MNVYTRESAMKISFRLAERRGAPAMLMEAPVSLNLAKRLAGGSTEIPAPVKTSPAAPAGRPGVFQRTITHNGSMVPIFSLRRISGAALRKVLLELCSGSTIFIKQGDSSWRKIRDEDEILINPDTELKSEKPLPKIEVKSLPNVNRD